MDESVNNLRGAIENLYAVFERYPLPSHVAGCPHCVSEEDHAKLYSAGLRDLESSSLWLYSAKAMTTWGRVDEFRHFLPRIFELIAAEGDGGPICPQIASSKLPYGHWHTWPQAEQDAIALFFGAAWCDVLSRYPHPLEAETGLCCIAQAMDDVRPYLAAWEIACSVSAVQHLNQCVWGLSRLLKCRYSILENFWIERASPRQQFHAWLFDSARGQELAACQMRFAADAEASRIISRTQRRLDGLHHLNAVVPEESRKKWITIKRPKSTAD